MLLKDLPREALLRPLTRNEVFGMLLRLTIFGAATYYSIKWVMEAMDPTQKQKNLAKKKVSFFFFYQTVNVIFRLCCIVTLYCSKKCCIRFARQSC
jgi:hypothetical protein